MRPRASGRRQPIWLPLVLWVLATAPGWAQTADDRFVAALGELREATFTDKETIAERLMAEGHPAVLPTLTALLEERLYVRQEDQKVVIVPAAVVDGATTVDLVDPLSQRSSGSAPAESLTRIGTNNRLRRFLRTSLARWALSNSDPAVRLEAVTQMLRSLDEPTVEALRAHSAGERDAAVAYAIATGLALAALDGSERASRLEAIGTLGTRLDAGVRNRLARLIETQEDGTFAEPDAEIRAAAAAAVASIDRWRRFYGAIETFFFGLSLGSVLVLAAIGLAITFGVMGVINMAHGELIMLGAYTVYVVQSLLPAYAGASLVLAIPAAFLVAGVVGMILERTIIRFLYGRPLETLLATFGVSLVLQQLVRSVFSANNRIVETPGWMTGTLQINGALSFTYNRLYIVAFTMLVFGVLLVVLKRTRVGLHIRAVAQNRAMARAVGIRSGRVDALTFGLGSGIAGVAGVALSQLTNVGPNLGQAYIIDSFMVVVFGGVGNLWGTLIGGMSLGIANTLLEPYAGAVLAKIGVLVALILFIQRRPRGLFPQTGRAAEGT